MSFGSILSPQDKNVVSLITFCQAVLSTRKKSFIILERCLQSLVVMVKKVCALDKSGETNAVRQICQTYHSFIANALGSQSTEVNTTDASCIQIAKSLRWNTDLSLSILLSPPPHSHSCFFSVFFQTALLRYNLHTMKFAPFKCTIQQLLENLHSCVNITIQFLSISICPGTPLCSLAVTPHSLHPPVPSPWKPLIYFVSKDFPILDISYKWNPTYNT